jgi:ribosome-binding ATPase YchF (GTP1/OBG family)
VEIVDIAGLVKGASTGAGRGNQFLSHIREVGLIVHVVRCFDDGDIIHVNNKVDPLSDMETINIELALADLDTLTKRRERAERSRKVQGKQEQKSAETVISALDKIGPALERGLPARSVDLSAEEAASVYDCHFITMKPQLYVCNVDEAGMRAVVSGEAAGGHTGAGYAAKVRQQAAAEGSGAVAICGKFEAELGAIEDPEEPQAVSGARRRPVDRHRLDPYNTSVWLLTAALSGSPMWENPLFFRPLVPPRRKRQIILFVR